MSRRLTAGVAIAAMAFALSACGTSEDTTAETTTETTTETTAATSEEAAADALTLEEPVVRAMPAGKGMTGVFGTLTNHTDKDINLVAFSTNLEADTIKYELHETVDGVMREIEGGFVIPANGTYELAPGADHMMIMGYPDEIAAGDTIDVTLEDADGHTYEIPDVAVRTLLPGDENYGEDGELMGHDPSATMTEGEMGTMESHEGH